MPAHRAALVALVAAAACGRIGYDEHAAKIDADPTPSCGAATLPLCADDRVCIDVTERGYAPWSDARTTCTEAGGRLCTDAEWARACGCQPTLVDMFNDQGGTALEWEWLAEEMDGTAWKRGYDTCDATSTHPITDSYDFRCCFDR